MAELNEAESTKDTKKTKKEKKMEEKAAKKAAKKAKKNHEADKPDAENDDSDSLKQDSHGACYYTYYCNMAWNICSFCKSRCGWLWLDCACAGTKGCACTK